MVCTTLIETVRSGEYQAWPTASPPWRKHVDHSLALLEESVGRRQQLKRGDAMTEAEQIAWCQGLGAMVFGREQTGPTIIRQGAIGNRQRGMVGGDLLSARKPKGSNGE